MVNVYEIENGCTYNEFKKIVREIYEEFREYDINIISKITCITYPLIGKRPSEKVNKSDCQKLITTYDILHTLKEFNLLIK